MKVFMSWSGDRSKQAAVALGEWLQDLVQSAEPFLSPDIEKGARWEGAVRNALAESHVGIVVLTRENLSSPWVLFEAGALSRAEDAHVCTFLLDVEPGAVKPPLGHFQATAFAEPDLRRLAQTVNAKAAAAGGTQLDESRLNRLFSLHWKDLAEKLAGIRDSVSLPEPARTDREVLDEILGILRSQQHEPAQTALEKYLDDEFRKADLLRAVVPVGAGKSRINSINPKEISEALERLRGNPSRLTLKHVGRDPKPAPPEPTEE